MMPKTGTLSKERGHEYRFFISPHLNERLQQQTTLITIETTKLFASFRYELSVNEEQKGKTLRYNILGLKAPQLDLPSSGSARFVREYEQLKGTYHIEVVSLDGTVNSCDVSITKKAITLLKPLTSSFVEFVVP
jgi:hypothetical protein